MHRQPLLESLRRYREAHPDEHAVADQFREFVEQHPDCFERSLLVGHLTGAAWILNRAGTHVLLTHHRKLDRWLQLGGHADGDPDMLRVAAKEAEEESGIPTLEPASEDIFDLDVHAIPARGDVPEHFHYDVRFRFRATDSEDFTVSDESHDLAWVPLETLSDYTSEESMLRMAQKTQL